MARRKSSGKLNRRHGVPRYPTRKKRTGGKRRDTRIYWVYVIQSDQPRYDKDGVRVPGYFYVGCTNNLARRIRQHNGEIVGGGKYTEKLRPWVPRAVYGPYEGRSAAMKAEYALKKKKRGEGRLRWSKADSHWCRGPGIQHPWVKDAAWKPEEDED